MVELMVIKARKVELVRKLNTFDATNLVIGSTIGADIYVTAALVAKLIGPDSLLVWVLAGIMAIVIAMSFGYSATIMPKVGGPYSYIRDIIGPFGGFTVGWSLFLAEWFSLAVFPVAFTRYLVSLVPSLSQYDIWLKALFTIVVAATNVFGVKAAGKFNDILTIGKLAPLFILMTLGVAFVGFHPDITLPNLSLSTRVDLGSAGQALVLIFWAYAGFELSTLPADEIERPEKTIPRALAIGMLIVTVFYLVVDFVVIGVVQQETLSNSTTPLLDAALKVFSVFPSLSLVGVYVLGFGAVVSIMGADESGTIGTSRLAYALSIDGLLPKMFSKLQAKYQTPYLGLILICLTAFLASVFGTLTELINASMFLLALVYFATCVSTIFLEKKYSHASRNLRGRTLIPLLGAIFSLILMAQVNAQQILVSLILIAIGIPIYMFFAPKEEIKELKAEYLSQEQILGRAYEKGDVFLAHLVRHIKWIIYKYTKKERAWHAEESQST